MSRHSQKAFTLIESVIALMLLAILSIMAYQATEVILGASERSEENYNEEKKLLLAWNVITRDLMHLRARPFADGFGGIEPAYQSGRTAIVSFTTGGGLQSLANPTGLNRIDYLVNNDGQLVRRSIPAIVSPRLGQFQQQVLLDNVSSISFEQLGEDEIYSTNWPPVNMAAEQAVNILPRMIRVSIELESGQASWKLLPGVNFNG